MFSENTFRQHLNTINANRQDYQSGFRPGTQTLDRDKYDENKRQFDASLQETQAGRKQSALQHALSLDENRRQFDLSHDLATIRTNYDVSKPYFSNSSGGASTNDLERNALADAYDAIDAAIASGVDYETLKNNLKSYEADFTRQGIRLADTILYLDNKVADAEGRPRSTGDLLKDAEAKSNYEKQQKQLEKQQLQARPFLQKAIDAILPGKQYR